MNKYKLTWLYLILCFFSSFTIKQPSVQIETVKADSIETEIVESIEPVSMVLVSMPAVTNIDIPESKMDEPIYEEEIKEIKEDSKKESKNLTFTDDEIDLIALITMSEAEGECEKGKRLVIDVILNRLDSDMFPNTIYDVIYQPEQFSCVWNGRINDCYIKDDIRNLVIEEMESRLNYEVLFFRTKHYHTFGTPLFQVEHHYFSGL